MFIRAALSSACVLLLGFTFRFADDFEVAKKDWRPSGNQAEVMNAMVVPNGTYEICSRTVGMPTNESIIWVLNINWQMQGLNINLDTNIGKHVSALGSTLTSIMPEERLIESYESDTTLCKPSDITKPIVSLPIVCIAPHASDAQDVANMNPQAIVEAMNKQSKIIEDLKLSGAPKEAIHAEQSRLTTLEIALFKDVCRDIAKKLNRQMQIKPHSDKTERSKSEDPCWTGEPEVIFSEIEDPPQSLKRTSLSHTNLDQSVQKVPSFRRFSVAGQSDQYLSSYATTLSTHNLRMMDMTKTTDVANDQDDSAKSHDITTPFKVTQSLDKNNVVDER